MDALWAWLWGTGWFWFALFWVALFVNGRAAFKLLLDWKGMLTTCRFVEQAYAARTTLPDEAALEKDPAAPVFVHLVPAWQEPAIAATLRALLESRYPHARLHIVVATREAEELSPAPHDGGVDRGDRPPLPRRATALAAEDALARLDAGRGEKGPPAQLGAPARGAQAPARPPVRSRARLDRR